MRTEGFQAERCTSIQWCLLRWVILSFVNNVRTKDGGTHETVTEDSITIWTIACKDRSSRERLQIWRSDYWKLSPLSFDLGVICKVWRTNQRLEVHSCLGPVATDCRHKLTSSLVENGVTCTDPQGYRAPRCAELLEGARDESQKQRRTKKDKGLFCLVNWPCAQPRILPRTNPCRMKETPALWICCCCRDLSFF